MKHSYEGIPTYGSGKLPLSEHASLRERIAFVTTIDYRLLSKKTDKERMALNWSESSFKKFLNNPYYQEYRGETIKQIVNSNPPNWGGFKLVML